MLTTAHNWFLSSVRCIQSASSYPIRLRSISILKFHLCLCLPSDFYPLNFLTIILYTFFILLCILYISPNLFPWFDYPNNIGEACKYEVPHHENFFNSFLLPLRSKLPQHTVHKYYWNVWFSLVYWRSGVFNLAA
jgi:hypothetical protein